MSARLNEFWPIFTVESLEDIHSSIQLFNDNKSFTPTELTCRRQQTLPGYYSQHIYFFDISFDSEEVYNALFDGLGMCQDTDH